jgi:hypothetical protein
MSRKAVFLLATAGVCALLAGATAALAARHAVDLTAGDVTAYGASAGKAARYFSVKVPIPEVIRGKELYGAYVEMYVDVETVERDGPVNNAPVLEAFALESAVAGEVDEKQLGVPAFGPRNVARGENRRVVLDVTDIVRAYLDDPASNHGLIIGSLTGIRDGRFTVKTGVLGRDAMARVIFHYRDR